MDTITLYLAHPFESREYVREWELLIEGKYEIALYNPFYDSKRDDIHKIDAGEIDRYRVEPQRIVSDDLRAINNTMATLAIIDGNKSYGTIMEIVYAFDKYKKPVYIIVTNGEEMHPWLRYHAMGLWTSLADFEQDIDIMIKTFQETRLYGI